MAAIGHRCADCGHMEYQHEEGPSGVQCSCGWCPCTAVDPMTPEIVPTFDARGRFLPVVAPPGSALFYGTTGPYARIAACACEACEALYATCMAEPPTVGRYLAPAT